MLREISLKKVHKSQHIVPIVLIAIVVLLANSISLFKGNDSNPLLQRSDIASSTIHSSVAGQDSIDPNDGYTSQSLGHLAARDWIHRTIPYWDPYEGVGAPLAGEMQSASFSPFTIILIFANGLLYMHIILEIVAGAATYFLLRRLKLSTKIAVFGGIAFALNGTFSWLANAAFNPIAFLPVILLGIEIAYNNSYEHKRRGWFFIAIGIMLSIYSGFPETAYIDGLLVLVWSIARFIQLPKEVRKAFVFKLITGGSLGVLLALPILIAFLDYLKNGDVGIHAGANNVGLLSMGLPSLIMPYMYGSIFGQYAYDPTGYLGGWWSSVGGYITTGLLALAIIGFFGKKDRPLRLILGGWIAFTILRVYGFFDLGKILSYVPGIKSTAFYRYAQPSFEFALVILAAMGIYDLVKNKTSIKVRAFAAVSMVIIISAAIVKAIPELMHISGAPDVRWWVSFSIFLAVSVTTVVFLVQLIKREKIKEYLLIIVVLLEIFILFLIPQLSIPKQIVFSDSPIQYLKTNLGLYRFYTLGPIQPNYGAYYRISSIDINDIPIPKDYATYITKNLDANAIPLVFNGTIMQNVNGQTPLQAFINNISAYEEVGVKYLVAPVGQITTDQAAAINIKNVFTTSTIDIYELPSPKPFYEITSGSCLESNVSLNQLDVNCSSSATLIRREMYMPGWTASISSKTVKLSRSDEIFQSINIPPGRHKIIYSYSPPYINYGYITDLLIIVVIVTGVILYKSPTTRSKLSYKNFKRKR